MEEAGGVEVRALGELGVGHEVLDLLRLLHDHDGEVIHLKGLVYLDAVGDADLNERELEVNQLELSGALIFEPDGLDGDSLVVHARPVCSVNEGVEVPLASPEVDESG